MKKLNYDFEQKYLVFDFETENLSLINNRIWQIGFSLCQGNRILESHDLKVFHSDLNMSPDAARITRFDWGQYKSEAIEEEAAYALFEPFLWDENIIPLGHNIYAFDLPVYRLQCLRRGTWRGWRGLHQRCLDTLALSRIYNDNRKPESDLYASQMKEITKPPRGAKKANLSFMAKSFGIEFDENTLHDAAADITLNFKVFNELKYKLDL